MRSALAGTPSGLSGRSATAIDDDERSPYAMAQDGLAELIEASVQAQRVEAMNAAMRVDLIFLTVSYALRSEEAFVAPSLSPQRRREMAHRSVTSELATALHVPERTMERQIDEAWALSTTLPATLAGAARRFDQHSARPRHRRRDDRTRRRPGAPRSPRRAACTRRYDDHRRHAAPQGPRVARGARR